MLNMSPIILVIFPRVNPMTAGRWASQLRGRHEEGVRDPWFHGRLNSPSAGYHCRRASRMSAVPLSCCASSSRAGLEAGVPSRRATVPTGGGRSEATVSVA